MLRSLLYLGILVVWLETTGQSGSEIFDVRELIAQADTEGKRYLRFLDNDALSSGIYQLNAGDVDQQQPHQWDEIYYVLDGEGQLEVEDDVFEVKKGGILFVAANLDHRFVNIQRDLKLLVFFSKATP